MKSRRSLQILGIALGLAALQGLLIVIYREVERGRHASAAPEFRYERLPSSRATELILESPDGTSQKLSERRGRLVLLHFWATWCPPCREELPGLLDLGRQLSAAGKLEVIAVSLDTEWTAVRDFFDGAIPGEIVRDASGSAQGTYDLSTLPDTYLLSADGAILGRFAGARDWRTPLAREAVLRAGRGD